jgi:hypothetical protein
LASAWVRTGVLSPYAVDMPDVSARLEIIANQTGLVNVLIFMTILVLVFLDVMICIRSIVRLPENPSCRFEALTVGGDPAGNYCLILCLILRRIFDLTLHALLGSDHLLLQSDSQTKLEPAYRGLLTIVLLGSTTSDC